MCIPVRGDAVWCSSLMCPLSNRSLRRPCVRELFARPSAPAEKADVWSLGVVFWEMLTLEVPFADMPPAQLIGGERGERACVCVRPTCCRLRRSLHRCREARSLCGPCMLLYTVLKDIPLPCAFSPTPHPAALGLGKLRLAIPPWCEPPWRALMESCWVEDPALRPSCRQLATHLERIRDMAVA